MKQTLLLLLIGLACISTLYGQTRDLRKVADSIVNEANIIYHSEWASWYGSDIFLEKCKGKSGQMGGYISYDTGKGLNNVFFSKGADPVVLGTTTFGYELNSHSYTLDTMARKLTPFEMELYYMRQNSIKHMLTDTTFKSYRNSSLNPVPVIIRGLKKVYVLTGPSVNGVVIFGNDYLININADNSVNSVKRIHKNIIPTAFGKSSSDSNKTVLAAMHTHLPTTGDFITSTDLCTLMLYEHFTTWNQYYVTSKDYVSIWDCKKNSLKIITMEAWKTTNMLKDALESSKSN